MSTAVKITTTGAVSAEEYALLCKTYGVDVTEWKGYELLARAGKLRMVTYACSACCQPPGVAARGALPH